MRPVPIEDDQIPEGAQRKAVMSPRDIDDPHFMSLEALVEWIVDPEEEKIQFAKLSVLMQLSEEDIDKLVSNGGKFWYTTLGHPMRPFNMQPLEEE